MVETGHELTNCDGVCCRYSWHPNWNWPEGRRKSLCLRGCFGLAGQEHEMCSVGELPLWVNAKWRSFLLDSLLSKTAEVQVPVQVQVLLKKYLVVYASSSQSLRLNLSLPWQSNHVSLLLYSVSLSTVSEVYLSSRIPGLARSDFTCA